MSEPTTNCKVAILTGTTASGKTSIALEFARRQGAIEIINADSIVIYRGMDIGSAKPTSAEQAEIRHHLVDVVNPNERFTAGDFRRLAFSALEDIHRRGKRALMVGGTGFYLKALLFGLWDAPEIQPEAWEEFRKQMRSFTPDQLYLRLKTLDPESAVKIHPSDQYRVLRALEILEINKKRPSELEKDHSKIPDPRFELLVIDRAKDELQARIHTRTCEMLNQGWIEEVRTLLKRFPEARPLDSVGYRQVRAHIEGALPRGRKSDLSIESLISEIDLATRQLCKRQRTWFRSQPTAKCYMLDQDLPELLKSLELTYSV